MLWKRWGKNRDATVSEEGRRRRRRSSVVTRARQPWIPASYHYCIPELLGNALHVSAGPASSRAGPSRCVPDLVYFEPLPGTAIQSAARTRRAANQVVETVRGGHIRSVRNEGRNLRSGWVWAAVARCQQAGIPARKKETAHSLPLSRPQHPQHAPTSRPPNSQARVQGRVVLGLGPGNHSARSRLGHTLLHQTGPPGEPDGLHSIHCSPVPAARHFVRSLNSRRVSLRFDIRLDALHISI